MKTYLIAGFIILGLLAVLGQTVYGLGQASGKEEANKAAQQIIQEYKEAIARQTDLLNDTLQKEAVDLTKEVKTLLKDTQDIKKQLKASPEPIIIVKDGECVVSESMLDARRKMIERVNQ